MSTTSHRFARNVDAIAFAPSDNNVAIVTSNLTGEYWDGEIQVLSSDLKTAKHSLPCHASMTDVAWGQGKDKLLVGASDDGQIYLWSAAQSELIGSLNDHDDAVHCVAISPAQPSLLLSGSADCSIKLWSLTSESSHSEKTFSSHSDIVYDVDWIDVNAQTFLSGSRDGTARLWDARGTSHAGSVSAGVSVYAVGVSPRDTHLFAIGCEDGSVRCYDSRNLTQSVSHQAAHTKAVRKVAFSSDGTLASAGDDFRVVVSKDSQSYVFAGHKDVVRALAWHPSSPHVLVSGSWDRTVCSYDITQLQASS